MKEQWNALKRMLGHKKIGQAVFALGVLGILLIFLSTFFGGEKPAEETEQPPTDQAYAEKLEGKIGELVSAITGNGSIKVVVTLETGTEYIYANAHKQDTDKTEEQAVQGSTKVRETGKEEQNYIIVKNKDGSEEALLVTELMPRIRGVAVVCAGGIEEGLKTQIIEAVTTALNISAKKVSVTGGAAPPENSK